LEIEDAFVSALNLRNYETIKYFLENGFKINEVAEDSVLTVCYALEYLRGEDAPFELLKLMYLFVKADFPMEQTLGKPAIVIHKLLCTWLHNTETSAL
jgi:hypothetical protein